jgi:hypothetical protein
MRCPRPVSTGDGILHVSVRDDGRGGVDFGLARL